MRVLKGLVYSFLLIAVVGGIGFLVAREVWLQYAITQLRSSASQLRKISSDTSTYYNECRKKGIAGGGVDEVQLRFVSENEYVVEVICSNFKLDPVEVERKQLPMFVTKVPGSSGLVWNQGTSAVTLELWQRHRSVGIENFIVINGLPKTAVPDNHLPITSCSGYGYSCCQQELNSGEGNLFNFVTDCPKSCYASCSPRPVILSITSSPFYDQSTRVLDLPRGETVEIGFVSDPNGLEGVETTINLGDGTLEKFSEINGTTTHNYNCPTGNCTFDVLVTAESADGIKSFPSPISKIRVMIK